MGDTDAAVPKEPDAATPAENEEEGEIHDSDPPLADKLAESSDDNAPPLPDEEPPPLPDEPTPEDDGWQPVWDAAKQAWYFYNRFSGKSQWENPRVPEASSSSAPGAASDAPAPTSEAKSTGAAGGYNPAIHGDYDENAWYAQNARAATDPSASSLAQTTAEGAASYDYATGALFNRHTGQWQTADQGPERHSDEAKSRRQMNAYFDVDAAANMHDGRSLKAERAGKKPTKAELKMFKEKRRAKKEEKRRAWLRD